MPMPQRESEDSSMFISGQESNASVPHLPPRSHSADGTAQRSTSFPPLKPIRAVDPFLNTSPTPSPVAGKDGLPASSMRPKLKVRIPLGESSDGQITSADKSRSGTLSDEMERRNTAPKSAGPMSAGPLTGTNNGSSWGTLLLPPPSPSSYLSNNIGGGPGNPFGRPPLVSSTTGEQTPLSAAAPSRYVNELLPSPSNFYGGDWGLFGGGPTSGSGSSASQVTANSLQTPSGTGLLSGSLSQRNNHLSLDMLPSPLQFNTPVVASSSQSLMDHAATSSSNKSPTASSSAASTASTATTAPTTTGDKRDSAGATAVLEPSAKRLKLEPTSPVGRRF